ncbi:MAG TPA: RNA 2',3'-cyclic phosphodiesterase, partial [Azonexus sp.]|nr:RNA 2',3'-cyclic phosphodiesterase [Azonexus sp.]
LWPSPELASRLADLAQVAAGKLGGRPTSAETIHLTLAFLGDTAVSRVPKLHALARQVRAGAFIVNIDRLGYWQHNRLFWAGCNERHEQLAELHGRLQSALTGAGYPVDPPGRPFTPHVTLLRKLPAGTTAAKLNELPVPERLSWPCDRFVLVQSEPASREHRYRLLGEYPLA